MPIRSRSAPEDQSIVNIERSIDAIEMKFIDHASNMHNLNFSMKDGSGYKRKQRCFFNTTHGLHEGNSGNERQPKKP